MRQRLAAAGIAIGACAGYYLGSVLGLLLRVPPATPSVLWPPNAILTAALLLVPPRRWWLVLVPVLPVHLLAQLPTEWPLPLVFALYLTNCSEAILTAGIVWLLCESPQRLDTLRRLSIFFMAVGCGTLASTFLDAAAVWWFVGEPYWTVWLNRLFSNILAQLTIVTAIVGVATSLPALFRSSSWVRTAEAAVVATGLAVAGMSHVGDGSPELAPLRAVSTQTPLVLQLPFLLWAAARFGTGGAGITLLATTILAVWSAVQNQGPFASMSPTTTGSALTLSLTVMSVTMLSLAALIEERRQTQHALGERLRFEQLLSGVSGAFVQVPSDRMAAGFGEWLGRIGTFLDVKCVRVYTRTGQDLDLYAAYEWTHPDYPRRPPPVVTRDFPWATGILERGMPVVVSSIDDVPVDAVEDRRAMKEHGYEAVLVLPMVSGNRGLGALAFGAARARAWPDELVTKLRLVAEVLANALARKQTEDALRASEMMKSSILDSLRSGVAVVDREGRVLALNESWARLAHEGASLELRVGNNLLDAPPHVAGRTSVHDAEVRAGVAKVLDGVGDSFVHEYSTQSPLGPRWWSVVVVPLDRPAGGAVVTCADVTQLRRAELDVQRSRQELAHVSRVSTVGELTASLAHELYQPLTAIMTNAQAARRLLSSVQPDLPQVSAILSDIVNDDRRARDVIERLRDLLRKGELEMVRIDLTSIIRDVADLLSSEAILKQVSVQLDLERNPVVVMGDRVQLQQVMLNLLHNAMEAIGDRGGSETAVSVQCRLWRGSAALVTVADTGPGLHAGAEELVFEPFYTTKRDGMGMGLSIVRSILESHGGSIKAVNGGTRGAVFEFTLPLASEDQQRAGAAAG
jgi:two-component system, LuxR family, sensor kinase FixL